MLTFRSVIHKILSEKEVENLRKMRRDFRNSKLMLRVKYWYFRLASSHQILSSLHYLLFSSAFYREHHAVAHGKFAYFRKASDLLFNRYLLRRNIHRLEKGLLMRPRRSVFARDYIRETIECYIIALRAKDKDEKEIKWANDILTEYFQIVDVSAEPIIKDSKEQFEAVQETTQAASSRYLPYQRRLGEQPVVNYDNFLNLSIHRRSVRWYLPRKVSRNLVDKAIRAATYAPSACNRQPFHFRVYDDVDLVRSISTLPLGTVGFHHNIPTIVVLVGELDAYFNERDRHLIYIDASLAAMSFMYALETLGLSSCPINWADVSSRENKMKQLLNLDHHERPIMLISVGYADPEGWIAYSKKRSLDSIRSYNKK